MNRSKKQLLLCGTNYGETYLPAIHESKTFELCGILARGSDRSLRVSEQNGVPLFTSISDLDIDIDIACVAIGSSAGRETAEALLSRGIPVLIEHPVNEEDLKVLLQKAEQHNTYCHINSHFSDLPPTTDFIKMCSALNSRGRAKIINLSCNSRTLFSLLDIVQRSFTENGVKKLSLSVVNTTAIGPYTNISIMLNNIPCTLSYQNWRHHKDDSKDSPLGHQVNVTYDKGVLCLAGTFGPSLWFPLLASGLPSTLPICTSSSPVHTTPEHMFHWRKKANHKNLKELLECQLQSKHAYSNQTPEYLSQLCTTWSHLNKALKLIYIDSELHVLNQVYWTAEKLSTLSSKL